MNNQGGNIEYAFNYALGELVQRMTARRNGGRIEVHIEETRMLIAQGKHVDVLITRPCLPSCAIENSYDARDAEKDARGRLGNSVNSMSPIRVACALHIPDKFRKLSVSDARRELDSGETVRYAVYQIVGGKSLRTRGNANQITGGIERRWPEKGFVEGTVSDLVAVLLASALSKEKIAEVADVVAQSVGEAAWFMENLPPAAQEKMSRLIHRGETLQNMKTVMVLWLNALHTQKQLSRYHKQIKPLDPDVVPVDVGRLVECWEKILELNWKAIFEPAVGALREARECAHSEASQALGVLNGAVGVMEREGLGAQVNIGGELFPKLIDDRNESAAFYTNSAVAELLATLTIRRQDIDDSEWRDPEMFRRRTIADLACGTGTLLRAGYDRARMIHELFREAKDSSDDEIGNNEKNFHKSAMEHGLTGADISPIAAHLTSSSLAMLGGGHKYGDTNIGYVDVGGDDAKTGSLEFFRTTNIQDMFAEGIGRSSGGG